MGESLLTDTPRPAAAAASPASGVSMSTDTAPSFNELLLLLLPMRPTCCCCCCLEWRLAGRGASFGGLLSPFTVVAGSGSELESEPLSSVLAEGPLPPPRALRFRAPLPPTTGDFSAAAVATASFGCFPDLSGLDTRDGARVRGGDAAPPSDRAISPRAAGTGAGTGPAGPVGTTATTTPPFAARDAARVSLVRVAWPCVLAAWPFGVGPEALVVLTVAQAASSASIRPSAAVVPL
jgi:hypothetical protein